MFELPEDITALSTEDLATLLDQAVAAFDEASGADEVTADDLAALRRLRADIGAIRGEIAEREQAAQAAADEIATMRGEVLGPDDDDDPDAPAEDGDGDGGAGDEVDPDEATTPEVVTAEDGTPAEVPDDDLVTAAASGRRVLPVGRIRDRQPQRPVPESPDSTPGVVIVASADVPGLGTGQEITMDQLVAGVTGRANGLKHSKRAASAVVASYHLPFPEQLIVTDPGSAVEGTRTVIAAADQSRLDGGDLVASGGWCAPSETVYDIADVACPDMLWSAPEIQLTRGGLRFFQTPSLVVDDLTWVHTEADDIAGTEKPCLHIPCPDPIEVRCDAVGVCLESGILTDRHFPELTSWYVRNSMVAHEIRVSAVTFTAAVAASTALTAAETFGAFTAVFAQVALQIADIVEKHSLCESIAVEVTFPWWSRNAMLADIARQNGRRMDEVDPATISAAFATLGASVQWARGLAPSVPTDIGGTDPAAAWPSTVPFLIHPAGAFQIGRGAAVDLGAVYDSAKFTTNDFTALFTEECVALVNRGPESRFVTVPICPDGMTGAQISTDATAVCPIDAITVES